MYLDTDVVLALLKAEDWLSRAVDVDVLETPITSAATAIEVQYVMEDEWSRERLAKTHTNITYEGVDPTPLTPEDVAAAGALRGQYERVGIFDSIHLGTAWEREEPIVSTDTLYPAIDEVDHVDPRELE